MLSQLRCFSPMRRHDAIIYAIAATYAEPCRAIRAAAAIISFTPPTEPILLAYRYHLAGISKAYVTPRFTPSPLV